MNDTVKQLTTPDDFQAWVRGLVAHPIANEDRMMTNDEYEGHKASIKANGILATIKIYEGKILDGRNRVKAGLELHYKFKPTDFEEIKGTFAEAKARADALNNHRRHLTTDDKKKRVLKMIEEHPEWSNRQIAKACGVSHTTVGKERQEEEDDDKDFKKFAKDWDDLSDKHRERFADQFAADLRGLLASVATS
jgi:hypothetical protein